MVPRDSYAKNPKQPGQITQPSKSKERGVSTLCPLMRQGAGLRTSSQHFVINWFYCLKSHWHIGLFYILLYKHTVVLLILHAGPFPACSLVMKYMAFSSLKCPY